MRISDDGIMVVFEHKGRSVSYPAGDIDRWMVQMPGNRTAELLATEVLEVLRRMLRYAGSTPEYSQSFLDLVQAYDVLRRK